MHSLLTPNPAENAPAKVTRLLEAQTAVLKARRCPAQSGTNRALLEEAQSDTKQLFVKSLQSDTNRTSQRSNPTRNKRCWAARSPTQIAPRRGPIRHKTIVFEEPTVRHKSHLEEAQSDSKQRFSAKGPFVSIQGICSTQNNCFLATFPKTPLGPFPEMVHKTIVLCLPRGPFRHKSGFLGKA